MTASVRELLTPLIVGKKPDEFVFTRDGAPVGNFRKTWASVCVAAGVGWFHCPTCDEKITVNSDGPSIHCGRELGRSDLKYRGLIFHDLRRSAVRGLIRAGVSQKVAMSISGHKTIAVFQRYQIVSPADKQEATRMLEASQMQERERLKSQAIEFGQDSGIVAQKRTETGAISTVATRPANLPN
jgi:integrase